MENASNASLEKCSAAHIRSYLYYNINVEGSIHGGSYFPVGLCWKILGKWRISGYPHVRFHQAEVKLPGRCTMQELLEYSRRNTAVQGGK